MTDVFICQRCEKPGVEATGEDIRALYSQSKMRVCKECEKVIIAELKELLGPKIIKSIHRYLRDGGAVRH